MSDAAWTEAGLWLAVLASGLYHGVNPGMGWPLAVSAGLMERNSGALVTAVLSLGAGHLVAMLAMITPFAVLSSLMLWRWPIQIAASLLVIAYGAWLLIWRRHPRALSRIPPSQIGLWSFAVATPTVRH